MSPERACLKLLQIRLLLPLSRCHRPFLSPLPSKVPLPILKSNVRIGAWLLALLGWGLSAQAASFPLDPTQFDNPTLLVSPEISHSIIKAVGFAGEHRPYEPATPMGTQPGINLGVVLTLNQIPQDFNEALQKAGVRSTGLTTLPVPALNLHKGFGPFVDIGGSYIGYQDYRVYGADLKIALLRPDEGLTYALRLVYSTATLKIVNTKTWSPQFLVSRAMDFADPYIGVGYGSTSGKIEFPITISGLTTTLEGESSVTQFTAFGGVQIKTSGLLFDIEGQYSSAGVNSMGAKAGFAF